MDITPHLDRTAPRPRYRWLIALLLILSGSGNGVAAERQILRGHVPRDAVNLAPTGRLDGSKRLRLSLGLPSRDPEGLSQLLQDLYDPTSPRFRHFITPQQFADQFGPASDTYEALADFAKANGLEVKSRHPNRLILDVEGSVETIEKALHVRMRIYRHPKEPREFYAPDSEPSVDFAPRILHVSGLDNYTAPHSSASPKLTDLLHQITGRSGTNFGSGPGGSLAGNDFRAAYLPGVSLTGSDRVWDWSNPNSIMPVTSRLTKQSSDCPTFRSRMSRWMVG
jgi:hypothetical protein